MRHLPRRACSRCYRGGAGGTGRRRHQPPRPRGIAVRWSLMIVLAVLSAVTSTRCTAAMCRARLTTRASPLAAATMLMVGELVWYSYGASTSRKRQVQPNNAIQWRIMSDAHALGAGVYDFRGITDTLEESNQPPGAVAQGRHGPARPSSTSGVGLPVQQSAPQGPRTLHVPTLSLRQAADRDRGNGHGGGIRRFPLRGMPPVTFLARRD